MSCRNQYLFERKTLEQQLQGDDDALLGWLATVEVAMATYEAEKEEAARRSARFFQPFREAGQLRWRRKQQQEREAGSDALSEPLTDVIEQIAAVQQQQTIEHSPSSKASEQLLTEVPAYLQHSLRRSEPEDVDLTDFFSDLDGTDIGSPLNAASDSDSSLLQPGPFLVAILDMQFSSHSSYIPTRTRDLPWEPDSEETSGYSSSSPGGYLRSTATSAWSDKVELSQGTEQPRMDDGEYWLGELSFLGSSNSTYEGGTSHLTSTTGSSSSSSIGSATSAPSSILPTSSPTTSPKSPRQRIIVAADLRPAKDSAASEVLAMLTFLSERRRSGTENPITSLEVNHEVSLPLSVDTSGWLRQDSDSETSASSEGLPLRSLSL